MKWQRRAGKIGRDGSKEDRSTEFQGTDYNIKRGTSFIGIIYDEVWNVV